MSRRLNCVVALLCILVLTGCQNKSSESYKRMIESADEVLQVYEEDSEEVLADDLQTLNDVFLSRYTVAELSFKDIKSPGGIAILDDEILLTDSENNCLIKFSGDGKIVKSIGLSGGGSSEFLSPTAIAASNGNIYVLDTSNKRVQIIDTELNYKDYISLDNNDPIYKPQTIAVNKSGIYVGGLSFANSVIDMYSFDGIHSQYGANFVGPVQSSEDKVYAINSMSLFYDKENDSIGAVSTGPEYLLDVENGELKKVCDLPCGFNIVDFVITNKNIIAVSGSAASVFMLDLDGNYVGTIATISELRYEEAPQIECGENGELYLCMPMAGKVIKIYECVE